MKFRYILLFSLMIFSLSSCKKYLEAKPDQKMVVISTLKDLQAILDQTSDLLNTGLGVGEQASDNYYLTDANFAALQDYDKNVYYWNRDLQFRISSYGNEWARYYNQVFVANTVLDNIDKIVITGTEKQQHDNVNGQALFLRAISHFAIANIWSLAYDDISSATDLGVPLRLTPDFNQPTRRPSNLEVFSKITSDLKEAAGLLPAIPVHVRRGSKTAAYAYLARIYLSMRKYKECYDAANECLKIKKELIDFNSIDGSSNTPFASLPIENNKEIIYFSSMLALNDGTAFTDLDLYNSYNINDLRRDIYFYNASTHVYVFNGSYTGGVANFDGMAIDEVYLMRAEAAAFLGNIGDAMNDLNILMKMRWKNPASYTPFSASTKMEALDIIRRERRKELIMRDTRWMDIKRLNKEGANITLKRTVNGQNYVLPPNDLRYAMAIPEDIITLTGIPQNPR